MSLDVYLYDGTHEVVCGECGHARSERLCVYEANITHNLCQMASKAGCYEPLWRPEEIGITKAGQIVERLRAAVADMEAHPAYYRRFDSPNGWGRYEHFLPWCREYLAACERWPNALVVVSR